MTQSPKQKWTSASRWMCTAHVPASHFPSELERCWYCKAARPERKEAPVPKVYGIDFGTGDVTAVVEMKRNEAGDLVVTSHQIITRK